jgi:hypothetical protein
VGWLPAASFNNDKAGDSPGCHFSQCQFPAHILVAQVSAQCDQSPTQTSHVPHCRTTSQAPDARCRHRPMSKKQRAGKPSVRFCHLAPEITPECSQPTVQCRPRRHCSTAEARGYTACRQCSQEFVRVTVARPAFRCRSNSGGGRPAVCLNFLHQASAWACHLARSEPGPPRDLFSLFALLIDPDS